MALTRVVRPLRGGQITIPAEFRSNWNRRADLAPNHFGGTELRIRSGARYDAARGSSWARELYDLFAPVRKEAARRSEKEIDTTSTTR